MSEEKSPWLNYLALTTVIFAVCATLSTFKGGGYSTRSVITQTQASDQWAYYQAKNIRSNLYQLENDRLQLALDNLDPNADGKAIARYKKSITENNKRVEKYENEKKEIQMTAKSLESQRDEAQRHGQPFGFAVIFLQVAILISSIAGLFKRKALWLLALPVGAIGVVYFADGFLLLI